MQYAQSAGQAVNIPLNLAQAFVNGRSALLMEIENEPILIDAGDVFVLVQMLFNALVHAAQHFVALARAKHAVNQLEVIKLGRNHVAGLRALHPAQEAGVVISAGQRIDIRRAMQALAVIPINNQHTAHQKTADEGNHEQHAAHAGKKAVHLDADRFRRNLCYKEPWQRRAVVFQRFTAEVRMSAADHIQPVRIPSAEPLADALLHFAAHGIVTDDIAEQVCRKSIFRRGVLRAGGHRNDIALFIDDIAKTLPLKEVYIQQFSEDLRVIRYAGHADNLLRCVVNRNADDVNPLSRIQRIVQHAGNRRLALDASPEIIAVREIIFLAVVGNHFAVWVHEPDALDAVFLGIDVESVYPLLHILRIMGNIAREIIQKDESVLQLNA